MYIDDMLMSKRTSKKNDEASNGLWERERERENLEFRGKGEKTNLGQELRWDQGRCAIQEAFEVCLHWNLVKDQHDFLQRGEIEREREREFALILSPNSFWKV